MIDLHVKNTWTILKDKPKYIYCIIFSYEDVTNNYVDIKIIIINDNIYDLWLSSGTTRSKFYPGL